MPQLLRPSLASAPEVKRLPLAPAVSADGLVEGYASLFGVVDLGRDRVERGAFANSLAARGVRGIRFLFQHDPAEPIGAWTSVAEDARGLRVTGRLNLAVARARELHALLRQGALDGLSIGFRALKTARAAGGVRRLIEIDLWEISVVTFPMLPDARVGAVKRLSFPQRGECHARSRASANRLGSLEGSGRHVSLDSERRVQDQRLELRRSSLSAAI